MVELTLAAPAKDLPYTLRILEVTEEVFDELVDEDTRAELFDGVMVVYSPASLRHDDVSGFLRSLARLFAEARRLGKVLGPDSLIRLTSGRKFAPDLYFLRKRRVPRRMPRNQFEGAPDQVTEVLSPSNRDFDLGDKRLAYQKARVHEIWFIDLEAREVLVDRRGKQGYTSQVVTEGRLDSSVLAGFWIDVDWLWQEPLPDTLECLQEILGV